MLIKFWRMLFGVEVRTMWGADAWLQRGDRVLAYNMAESTDEAATEQCVVLEVIPLMKCAVVRTLYPWEIS